MNNNYKTTIVVFAILSVLIVTIVSAYSAVLTQAIQQTQAQTLNVTEQRAYITDVNVHFKTTCISIIVFTYCW
jgi:type II secretory pathway pseudopilin PulG